MSPEQLGVFGTLLIVEKNWARSRHQTLVEIGPVDKRNEGVGDRFRVAANTGFVFPGENEAMRVVVLVHLNVDDLPLVIDAIHVLSVRQRGRDTEDESVSLS